MRGAAAANTVVILPARSTIGVSDVAAAGSPVWVNVYADEPAAEAAARTAVEAGAGVVFITVGASYPAANAVATAAQTAAQVDWNLVESIRRSLDVPVVAKGIMTPAAAVGAVERGFSGLVVSNHAAASGNAGPMNVLAGIVDAVEGRVPVLVDGSFRRGTDVMKALILGADAALLARPVAWGLAAYGADGVSRVIQLVQNELARSMAMLGASTPAQLTRTHLRIHTRATS